MQCVEAASSGDALESGIADRNQVVTLRPVQHVCAAVAEQGVSRLAGDDHIGIRVTCQRFTGATAGMSNAAGEIAPENHVTLARFGGNVGVSKGRANHQIIKPVAIDITRVADRNPGSVRERYACEPESIVAIHRRKFNHPVRSRAARRVQRREVRCAAEDHVALAIVRWTGIGKLRADDQVIEPIAIHITRVAD